MTLFLKSVAPVPYVAQFSEVRGVVLALFSNLGEDERTNTRACSALSIDLITTRQVSYRQAACDIMAVVLEVDLGRVNTV